MANCDNCEDKGYVHCDKSFCSAGFGPHVEDCAVCDKFENAVQAQKTHADDIANGKCENCEFTGKYCGSCASLGFLCLGKGGQGREPQLTVERCDSCEVFESDSEAQHYHDDNQHCEARRRTAPQGMPIKPFNYDLYHGYAIDDKLRQEHMDLPLREFANMFAGWTLANSATGPRGGELGAYSTKHATAKYKTVPRGCILGLSGDRIPDNDPEHTKVVKNARHGTYSSAERLIVVAFPKACANCMNAGWFHMDAENVRGPEFHVEKCDSCKICKTDEEAYSKHYIECGCSKYNQPYADNDASVVARAQQEAPVS